MTLSAEQLAKFEALFGPKPAPGLNLLRWEGQLEGYTACQRDNEAAGWREMDSAPKNGTEILLQLGDTIHIGLWGSWPDRSYPFIWQTPGGSSLVRPWKEDAEPLGWQPLPALAAQPEEGE